MRSWYTIFFFSFVTSSMAATYSPDDIVKKSFNWQQDESIAASLTISGQQELIVNYSHYKQSNTEILLFQLCNKNQLKKALIIENGPKKTQSSLLSSAKAKKKVLDARGANFIGLATDNLLPLNQADYKYEWNEEDQRHYILRAIPNKAFALATGIGYKLLWIKKDNYLLQKSESYSATNKLLQKLVVTEAQRQNQKWRVISARIEDVVSKKSTILNWENFRNKNVNSPDQCEP